MRARHLRWVLALMAAALACTTFNRSPSPTAGTQSAATHTPEPTAASQPDNGLIAFIGRDNNIYTIRSGGEDQTAITDDAQQLGGDSGFKLYNYPTWSPDGRRLAFVTFLFEAGLRESRVEIASIDSGSVSEVFSSQAESPFYLYWAPDSERISFLTSSTAAPDLLMRIAFLSGEESIVADSGQPFYWVWAPDSGAIFVHEGGASLSNPGAGLYFLSPEGEKSENLSLSADFFQAPAWSPDGEQLLAAVGDNEQGFLSLLDREGDLIRVLSAYQNRISFSWSPDGAYIATLSTQARINSLLGTLQVIDPENPDTPLVSVRDPAMAYFWSPDSRLLAYITLESAGGVDAMMSTQRQEADGLLLKVLDMQTGITRQLAAFQPTEEVLQVLPFFDQYHHSATIWSPDSGAIVYASLRASDGPGIWVVAADGNTPPVRIADGTLAFWSWK